jgi:hypothetical protein
MKFLQAVKEAYWEIFNANGGLPYFEQLRDSTMSWAEERVYEECRIQEADDPDFHPYDEDDEYSDDLYFSYLEMFYNSEECYEWDSYLIDALSYWKFAYYDGEDEIVNGSGMQLELIEM